MPLLKRIEASHNGHGLMVAHATPQPVWGTSHDGKRQQRSLLAAATNLSNGLNSNRTEAARISKLKQAWQEDAWAYRDSIGELRYATTYLGNAARKVKLFPAAYVNNELDPLPLSEIPNCPANVLAAANDAMERLATNPLAMAGLLRDLMENLEVTGECFLFGWPVGTKPGDNKEEIWEIRSVSEVSSNNDGQILIKEVGQTGAGELVPNGVFTSRLWYPHPRRKILADSPFASILDICEELLILSRDIRAAGRSRLANSGLLLLPDGLTVVKADTAADANDSEQDPFMQELVAAAMTAIQDEGSASAIVPLIIRGPKDELAAVRQVTISRPESENANKRIELIERMATTLDLPAEVLTGKADLNHWTAWSVSDDTFSDHIEPLIMVMDDALVAGYMRIMLSAPSLNLPPEWVNRVIIWHDSTRLVRHPDRSQDALQAYDRFALSDGALRDTMGFSDTDAPNNTELLTRVMMKQSRLDPSIAAQIIKRMDSTLDISSVGGGKASQAPSAGQVGPSPTSVPTQPVEGPPQGGQPSQQPIGPAPPTPTLGGSVYPPKGLVAAIPAHISHGNSKLARIDSELMTKLMVATNAAMTRALERAGARIRTQVGKTASGRAWCASHKNIELPFLISHSMIAAAGLDEQQLLNGAWVQLKTTWETYMESADSDALNAIAKMLKVNPDELADKMDVLTEYGDSGWAWLEARMNKIAHGFLSDAQSLAGKDKEITTTDLVSWDTIKEAVSRAGGQPSTTSAGVTIGDDPTTPADALTGLGNGPVVTDTLVDGGLSINNYTWIHGTTPAPFPPHETLDGQDFVDWTDEILVNSDDWPDRDYFMPGDHDGCTCDFQINWADDQSQNQEQELEPVNAAITAGGPGSGPRPGQGKIESDPVKIDQAVKNGIPKQTAQKLERNGMLDDALAKSNEFFPKADVNDARQIASDKFNAYAPTITPEDKAAAQERHAAIQEAGGRRGGDDRPGPSVRARYNSELISQYGKDGGQTAPCLYCARTLTPDTATLERLVPGSEGGKYVMENLAPSCMTCNRVRSDSPFGTGLEQAA